MEQKRKRQRYRYVLNGMALGTNKISDFRLIGANNIKPEYSGQTALRVKIPDNLELCKYNCDSYSTTGDTRTLEELGYDVIAYNVNKKRWIVVNEYKGIEPHEMDVVSRPDFRRTDLFQSVVRIK